MPILQRLPVMDNCDSLLHKVPLQRFQSIACESAQKARNRNQDIMVNTNERTHYIVWFRWKKRILTSALRSL